MWRMVLFAGLVVLLAAGCEVVVPAETADAAPIPPVQFLRPVRDTVTGTWVAAWVDPDGFAGGTTQTTPN
jgi:hypothetical protein